MSIDWAKRGFSLLELLCVLGVLSVLCGAAFPRLAAVMPRIALDRAARQIADDLELARVKAIHRNARVRTVIDPAAGGYVVSVESEGRFVEEGGTRLLPSGSAVDAAESTRVSGGRISITYVPRGHTADNATIVLRSGEERRRVVVSASGRVRTE